MYIPSCSLKEKILKSGHKSIATSKTLTLLSESSKEKFKSFGEGRGVLKLKSTLSVKLTKDTFPALRRVFLFS